MIHVNPTGRFVIGGPMGDAGLTGRKIIVDTYGGMARHGGGASAARTRRRSTARRPTPRAGWPRTSSPPASPTASRSRSRYAIGIAKPLCVSIETFGTGQVSDERILGLIDQHFDLRPAAIIEALDLRRPIFRQTAAYGHFGRPDLDLPWERTDRAEALASDAGVRMPELEPATV